MNRIEALGHLLGREKDLCSVFWLAARSKTATTYGLDEDGSVKNLSVRRGFKNDDCGLNVYWEAREGSKHYPEVMVIAKDLNSRGEWVPTGIIRVRGQKHVG